MKKVPSNWTRFHILLTANSGKSDYTLSQLRHAAKVGFRIPRAYKALGWLRQVSAKEYYYIGPRRLLTLEMAMQVQEKNAELEKRYTSRASAHAADSLLEEIEAHKVKTADAWIATDEELVSELRRRGYEVTARKTVEL